jgi:hypothetical protein
MLKNIALLAVILLFCVSFVSGAANEDKAGINFASSALNYENYSITPAENPGNNYNPKYVSDTISQGETNWHTKNVNSHTTVLNVDLNWGDKSDSLRLKIYTPDWQCLGEYYDNADEKTDGRINIDIKRSTGIETGTWHYEVYGHRVDGAEDYTI